VLLNKGDHSGLLLLLCTGWQVIEGVPSEPFHPSPSPSPDLLMILLLLTIFISLNIQSPPSLAPLPSRLSWTRAAFPNWCNCRLSTRHHTPVSSLTPSLQKSVRGSTLHEVLFRCCGGCERAFPELAARPSTISSASDVPPTSTTKFQVAFVNPSRPDINSDRRPLNLVHPSITGTVADQYQINAFLTAVTLFNQL
jgi:hypothetical protein